MDSDVSLVVNLEVTVPRIVLPSGLNRHEPMQALATKQESESNESEEVEQVRLIGLQGDPSLHQSGEQQGGIGDVWTRMVHTIRFRVFRLTLPMYTEDQPFLFQVLRRWDKYMGKRRRKRNQANVRAHAEQLYATDAMAFSVKFRSSSEIVETSVAASTAISTPTLIPGLNRVVIYLNNEGTPAGYSIDGTES